MRRIAVFVDAGYFWVQVVHIVLGSKRPRDEVVVNYAKMRQALCDEVKSQFQSTDLLRIYWYDGPASNGKGDSHMSIEDLDDFKLRLGTRNSAGDQKAVDGLIIADIIGLAQCKSITDALLVSGDADLTPGVVASQGLGIRVHLLSMGPTNATSPFLKAEVDRKTHWPDDSVKSFASRNTVNAGHESSTASNRLVIAAMAMYSSLVANEVKQIPKSGVIPKEVDAKLLAAGKKELGRSLTNEEKPKLREEFRKLLSP
jgi:uncharacterized LabA/DUF88 family protein